MIDLRLSVDPNTNSIIAAGSPADLDVIAAIIAKLDVVNAVEQRRTEVFQLFNAQAADVATTLTNFYPALLTFYKTATGDTAYVEYQRNIIVVAEPVTNKLIVNVAPQIYPEIVRLIHEFDTQPAQVTVDCIIAEVDLTGNEEFGIQFGIQSPILFNRSTGNTQTTNTTAGTPGFDFNPPTGGPAALGNNFFSPGKVGYQGVTNLGVGTVSPTSGISGLVIQAQSDSFNFLLRALQLQGRLEVLSSPQVTTADNQAARVLVGQSFPYVTGSTTTVGTTVSPTVQNTVNYRDIGVQLQITPKISPDGTVTMRVVPEVSSATQSNVDIGNGVFAEAFNVQTVETTVIAQDGETVCIGGMIQKRDLKNENKVPWLGDLPYVGAAFRYRTQVKQKTELIVILTPHVLRHRGDREVQLRETAGKMDWDFSSVAKVYGVKNLVPLLPPGDLYVPGSVPPYAQPYGPGGPNCPVPGLQPELMPQPRQYTPGGQGYPMPQGPMSPAPVSLGGQQQHLVLPTAQLPVQPPAGPRMQ